MPSREVLRRGRANKNPGTRDASGQCCWNRCFAGIRILAPPRIPFQRVSKIESHVNRESIEFLLQVACDCRLRLIELRVLLYYLGRLNAASRISFASTPTIAQQTKIDSRHIKRARASLIKLGWITEAGSRGGATTYRVHVPPELLLTQKTRAQRDSSAIDPDAQSVSDREVAASATLAVALSAPGLVAVSATGAVAFEGKKGGETSHPIHKTTKTSDGNNGFKSHFLGSLVHNMADGSDKS